ncbi:uncharacterized protein LOC144132927 [Amblyomma americanum]
MWNGRGKTCCVVDCKNCDRDLKVWDESVCELHGPELHKDCPCLRPFAMHCFPAGERNKLVRQRWIANLQRKDFNPGKAARVCSIDFIDGRPTPNNPYRTLHLGTSTVRHKGRRVLKHRLVIAPMVETSSTGASTSHNTSIQHSPTQEEEESLSETDGTRPTATYLRPARSNGERTAAGCQTCGCRCKTVKKMEQAVQVDMKGDEDHTYCAASSPQRSTEAACQAAFTVCSTLQPHTFKFFTGLSKNLFDELVRALASTMKTPFELPFEDQVLLTLMRLRLGLLVHDLSFRFAISTAAVSRIFCTISSGLAKFARQYLVFWLARDTIKASIPDSFNRYELSTCIIDCFEIFIERPGNLKRRNRTYSRYKSHNTAKVLHAIAPCGFVMFVSKPYGGRASDRFITQHSGFLKFLAPGDTILADRGFTISDLLPAGVKLMLPSFSKGRSQISRPELVESRRLARLRIHVERSIRRIKCFRLLKELPSRFFAKKTTG